MTFYVKKIIKLFLMFSVLCFIYIDMQRKTRTYEELLAYKRAYSEKYYATNRERLQKEAVERYNKLKNDSINKNKP